MRATPTRIDQDVVDAAKVAASAMSRSAAQQINHWARIGRELEMSRELRHQEVVAVLAGQASYDFLTPREQAIVRADWDERATRLRLELDLAAGFTAEGRRWTEVDEQGELIEMNAGEQS